jgi:glutaredoxin
MNCLAKPTQRTGEPEAPARAGVPERFRRLKWNEVVWSGEAPGVFRAGSFARPIYWKEETERFRPTSTRKPKQNAKHAMKTPKITAYLKPTCGWSESVRAILGKSQSALEDRDIINNPFNYTEMLEKSGQCLSPCVEVNWHMLADVNGDEVEAYLLEAGVLHLTAAVADAPANWACDAHHHE